MTKKLFDLDSYLWDCPAVALSCQPAEKNGLTGFAVELDQTCFFPEGGGQPSDTGFLDEIPVLYVYETEGRIFHLCAQPVQVGQAITCRIDSPRRFQHMQSHCGEHILSGVILKKTGLKNIGFHMGTGYNTIDLDGELTAEQAAEIEQDCNRVITSNVPVKVSYPDPETLNSLPLRKRPQVEALRVVEVTGCDFCGCCGTHVSMTGEIGLLKIVDAQRYKGGTRLTFLCGGQAFADFQAKHQILKSVGASLSCKPLEVSVAVEHLRQENSDLKLALAKKNRELFGLLSETLYQSAETCAGIKWSFLARKDFSADDVKAIAMMLSKREGIFCTAFSLDETGGRYAIARGTDCPVSLRDFCQALNRLLNGKGGGNAELCCGKFDSPCSVEQLHSAAEEALRSL